MVTVTQTKIVGRAGCSVTKDSTSLFYIRLRPPCERRCSRMVLGFICILTKGKTRNREACQYYQAWLAGTDLYRCEAMKPCLMIDSGENARLEGG